METVEHVTCLLSFSYIYLNNPKRKLSTAHRQARSGEEEMRHVFLFLFFVFNRQSRCDKNNRVNRYFFPRVSLLKKH
jgi:hypothetical protein